MTARGLLFTGENYTKSENGQKWQTRRIMKPQPPYWVKDFGYTCFTPKGSISGRGTYEDKGPAEKFFKCPYGQPGDRLYCKESHYRWGKWVRNGLTKSGRQKWRFRVALAFPVLFALGVAEVQQRIRITDKNRLGWQKRSPLFMPRAAARLWLELTGVRVERLQEISEDDAKAEWARIPPLIYPDLPHEAYSYVENYRLIWESIHGPGSWNLNPLVWVLEYRRVQP